MITNTIYNFEYLNLQGQTIAIQFIPNVCETHTPTEIRLIENIFSIKDFVFGFEKDSIKKQNFKRSPVSIVCFFLFIILL